ncbi:MAG: hypothetical protein VCF07_05495, partial [Nitrospinota bacterium]
AENIPNYLIKRGKIAFSPRFRKEEGPRMSFSATLEEFYTRKVIEIMRGRCAIRAETPVGGSSRKFKRFISRF